MPLPTKSTYQILQQLPDSATPWQQDSAVQAYFRPGEHNRYSDRPDTLGLPGQRYERPSDVLAIDSLDHPVTYVDTLPVACRPGVKAGMMAVPTPYRPGHDNLMSSLLMASVVMALVALAFSGKFVVRMSKNFFFAENTRTTAVPDTAAELRNQGLLVLFTCLMLAVFYFSHSMASSSASLPLLSRHGLLAIDLGIIGGYFLLKAAVYQFVNWVFFDRKKIEQWNKALLFLTAMEGLALAPIVLLLIFGDLSMGNALVFVLIVVFLVKFLTFYKCYLIFFQRFGAFLQIFLYFCALELIPLAVLVGLLEFFNYNLKIFF